MESLQSQRTVKHQLILQMDAKKLINVPKNDKKVVIASNSGVFILSEAKSKSSISNYHHRLFQVMHFNNNKTKCNEIKFSDLLLTPRIINCIHSSFFGRSCEIFETVITYSKLKQVPSLYIDPKTHCCISMATVIIFETTKLSHNLLHDPLLPNINFNFISYLMLQCYDHPTVI